MKKMSEWKVMMDVWNPLMKGIALNSFWEMTKDAYLKLDERGKETFLHSMFGNFDSIENLKEYHKNKKEGK